MPNSAFQSRRAGERLVFVLALTRRAAQRERALRLLAVRSSLRSSAAAQARR